MSFLEKLNPFKIIREMNEASSAIRTHADNLAHKLIYGSKEEALAAKNEIKQNPDLLKNIINEDRQEGLREMGVLNKSESKSPKEIFYHFFGMNEAWPIGRNLLGGLMVHSPEWPTYFIPAYTQAKATGDASDLKKGEGPRGLITGGLEGIAVGALVSGRLLKPKEMGPYIILGAALQLFSSKLFPWIGEKMGQAYYKRNGLQALATNALKTIEPTNVNPVKNNLKPVQNPVAQNPATFKPVYSPAPSVGMKV